MAEDPLTNESSEISHREDEHGSSQGSLSTRLAEPAVPTITRKLVLDIPIFLAYFAINLASTVFQNQLLYQTCRVVYEYPEEECLPLLTESNENTTAIEDVVQPYVARVLMTRTLVESLIPAFICLFIGPWTDRYGRRTAILISLSGLMLSYMSNCIIAGIALVTPVNPYVYIVSSIPYTLCGGTCALVTVVFAYITDVVPEPLIATRMFINDAALGLGNVVGNLASSPIFVATNMCAIFGISAASFALAIIYCYYFAVDSMIVASSTIKQRVKAFFQWKLLKKCLACAVRDRPDKSRLFIWITMGCLIVVNFVTGGENNIFYLFAAKRFSLAISDYTTFNSIGVGIQVVGGFIGVILLRRVFKAPIIIMALVALACYMLQSIVRAAATLFWQLYLAAGLGFMSGLTNPMLYAILSNLVTTTEIGKIFALSNSMTTIAPLVSSPIYTSVYNASLGYYPGLFNVISAVLYALCVLSVSTMFVVRKTRGLATI